MCKVYILIFMCMFIFGKNTFYVSRNLQRGNQNSVNRRFGDAFGLLNLTFFIIVYDERIHF